MIFSSTSLPPSRLDGWVQYLFSSHCPLSTKKHHSLIWATSTYFSSEIFLWDTGGNLDGSVWDHGSVWPRFKSRNELDYFLLSSYRWYHLLCSKASRCLVLFARYVPLKIILFSSNARTTNTFRLWYHPWKCLRPPVLDLKVCLCSKNVVGLKLGSQLNLFLIYSVDSCLIMSAKILNS